ncbi:metallophosphoesterase family protein [Anaerosporobacter faecicola]|uniref:metallophosphoesterase family protein n=1 Tax=Anaerosporobacter faecicola TaxID=2718714 RepID=UPI0014390F1D|nr:metallophosphoesterase [Anaerosporobacter faecicola]
MDIAVFADLHGNYVAFEECLAYVRAKNIHTYLFLGDYVAEMANAQKTMKLLYDLQEQETCYFIKGNKEEYWLNHQQDRENNWKDFDSITGSLLYTYQSLKEQDFAFYQSLPAVMRLTFGTLPTMTICHGSPNHISEKLLPADLNTIELLKNAEDSLILCGHTHLQGKITYRDKRILNPGSVGLPFFSNCKTQFLILHDCGNTWEEEFISLPYDYEQTIRALKEAALDQHAPYWTIITSAILRGANVNHTQVLKKAMNLCREETGECVWPHIPEQFMERAVKEFGLLAPEFTTR